MFKCITEINGIEELWEILKPQRDDDFYIPLADIRRRHLDGHFMEFLENLNFDPSTEWIKNYLVHDLNDFYKEVGLYKEDELKKHPEINKMYYNLIDYHETYYEQDDLAENIFPEMTWKEITEIINKFLDEFPKCKPYIVVNNTKRNITISCEMENLFYWDRPI